MVSSPSTPVKDQRQKVSAGMKTPTKIESKLSPDVSNLVIKIGSPRKPGDPLVKKEEEVMDLHIWDFAGHELYYTTHQVIYPSR